MGLFKIKPKRRFVADVEIEYAAEAKRKSHGVKIPSQPWFWVVTVREDREHTPDEDYYTVTLKGWARTEANAKTLARRAAKSGKKSLSDKLSEPIKTTIRV